MPTVQKLETTLGAVVTDVKLASMDDGQWQTVLNAFHEHALLIFPAQHLSDDEQVQFAKRFGDIELLTANPDQKAVAISNKRPDGKAMDASEFRFRTLRGNEGWHTDSSYMPLAAKASVLSALQVPKQGGETEWADMRDAYDALTDAMREHIGGLSAYHSLYRSQSKIGHVVRTGDGYGYHNQGAPLRSLVKVHPVTGRPALYIGRHAYGIPGLTEDASEALLDALLANACQPPRVCAHSWSAGDVIIWDNRCVLHRARPYDFSEVRVMRHTRVAGDPSTELAETAPDELADGYAPTGTNFVHPDRYARGEL